MTEKLDYLKSIGAVIIESDDRGVSFNCFGYDYSIQFDEFEVGDDQETICQAADLYSCCGDIVDQDIMLCPSCKEHV